MVEELPKLVPNNKVDLKNGAIVVIVEVFKVKSFVPRSKSGKRD